jgi:hypothetical protein
VGATVAKLARAVNETVQPDGLSLVKANGEVAGQTVPHVHVHILPRRAGDNLLLNWDRNRVGDPVHADPVHLAALARRIRARLARTDKGIEALLCRPKRKEKPRRSGALHSGLKLHQVRDLRRQLVSMT